MPILSELDNFSAAGGTEVANRIRFVKDDVDKWLGDVTSSLAGSDFIRASAAATDVMRMQVLGPMGATLRTAEAIGVTEHGWGPTIEVLAQSYSLLKDAYEWVGEQVAAFIQGVVQDLMEIISPALEAVLHSLAVAAGAMKAIPWVGGLIAGMIDGFRFWKGLLARVAGGDPGKGSCAPFDWNGQSFAAADSLNATSWFSKIGGDVSELFMPPELSGFEYRKMNILNPKGTHYESSQQAGMHGYAPGIGTVAAFSTDLPYVGPRPSEGASKDVVDRWKVVYPWFNMNGQTIKPWVPFREHPGGPKKRWNAYPVFQAPNGGMGQYVQVPIDPYPKTTGICRYAFQETTGTGPQALMVDWGSISQEWLDFTVGDNYEGRTPLPDCEGFRYGGRISAFSKFPGDMLGQSIFMYDKEALIMKSALSFFSGEGIIPDPSGDFFTWMRGVLASKRWEVEVGETSRFIENPVEGFAQYNGWETPNSMHSAFWYVKYVCDYLAQRQTRLAASDASAYVKSDALASMRSRDLRMAIEDSRQRILAGGGAGIDMGMAYAADPAFAEEIKARKGKALWEAAQPMPPDLDSPKIYPPEGWVPPGSEPSQGRKSSLAPMLAIGGLAAAAFLIGKKR